VAWHAGEVALAPPTRYAVDGDDAIAYQVLGNGAPDVLYVPTASFPIDLMWDDPVLARGLRRLAAGRRLIAADLLGAGSSDPVRLAEPVMQGWADGLLAVLDEVGSTSASVISMAESGLPAMVLAATRPERVRSLVVDSPFARFLRGPDQPWGLPEHLLAGQVEAFRRVVGTGALVDVMAPSRAEDPYFRDWWARCERMAGGPTYFSRLVGLFLGTDVRPALRSIQAPTLLIRRTGDWHVRDGHASGMAQQMHDVLVVEQDGPDHVWFSGADEEWLDRIEEFLAGDRVSRATSRVLATVLFTDIVGSTERAAALGDAAWTQLLESHDALVRRYVTSFRGQVVTTTGDGVLATFDGPGRAIGCATELCRAVPSLGLHIRAGLHTGEIEPVDGDIRGIAVHVAARIMALAGPDEVLVSGAVPPLLLGSGLRFEERGRHTLKGVPDQWTVYCVRPR
jgi:class 3 adenylate cyclase